MIYNVSFLSLFACIQHLFHKSKDDLASLLININKAVLFQKGQFNHIRQNFYIFSLNILFQKANVDWVLA